MNFERQVEADVHIPLPDANRTFQLRQSIRGLQRAGTPLMLLAIHPGVIGFHVRREGMKRRARGKAIPLAAVHWCGYHEFVEHRMSEIVEVVVKKYGPTLHEFFTQDGSLEQLIPALAQHPELRDSLDRFVSLMQHVILHWYVIPSQQSANVGWGRFWLWLANFVSKYAHHRLQGSLAAANGLQEFSRLIEILLGVPLVELLKRPLDAHRLIAQAVADVVRQLMNQYHRMFYAQCDRVINLEGTKGEAYLQAAGVLSDSVFSLDLVGDVREQLYKLYGDIVRDSVSQIVPKRCKFSDFQWGPAVPGHEWAAAHLAISDVHLGDGSGTERAQATFALRTHCQDLGVRTMDIVGDLIQRDVPSELAEKHRDSFLRALRHVTGTVVSEQTRLRLLVDIEDKARLSTKQHAEVLRELQVCAIKLGALIQLGDNELGVPDDSFGEAINVFMERGNHDEGESLEDVVPGAQLTPSMIRHDGSSGILFCHGNIWNLPEVSQAFTQAESLSALAESLTEENLKASLETAQVIYSLTSALWRASAKRIDVRGIWKKDLQPALSRFVQWHRQRDSSGDKAISEFSQFMHGVISPVDNATVAAQCGALAQGFGEFCWAVCDGHSHRPAIQFTQCEHPVTHRDSGVLLVNCGKFHGKNITAVFLRFPEAVLVEWDERDQCYYVLRHYRLTEDQIELVQGNRQCNVNTVAPDFVESHPLADCPAEHPVAARILLEICTEGSGHAERQFALLPLYRSHGSVQVACSGPRSLPWAHEHWPGHRIVYDVAGRVQYASTGWAYLSNQAAIKKSARRIMDRLYDYTHLITDFAPTLPCAIQLARKSGLNNLPPLFHISHHAALHSQFIDTPRPVDVDRIAFWATQRYLDSITGDFNIGFHFERYHSQIFTPPLAPEVLNALPTFDSNMVVVYLPGCPKRTAKHCAAIDPTGEHEWHIYSSQIAHAEKSPWPHIWLFPLDSSYRAKVIHSRAVILASGFMGPSELLHLGKPFVAVTTDGHGEQAFNAAALREISHVAVAPTLEDSQWQANIASILGEAKSITKPLQRYGRMGPVGPYIDIRAAVVERVFPSSAESVRTEDYNEHQGSTTSVVGSAAF